MREEALRLSMLGSIPAFPSWWMIVIDGRCRISHPAALIRRQKSVSSEYMKKRGGPGVTLADGDDGREAGEGEHLGEEVLRAGLVDVLVVGGEVEVALPADLAHADQPYRRAGVHRANQVLEGALQDLGVRVQEQDVTGVAGHEPAVVRVREAVIARRHYAGVGKLGLDHGRCPVARLVVHHDDVRADIPHVGEHRAQAGPEPVGLAGRDGDDCDVVHAR